MKKYVAIFCISCLLIACTGEREVGKLPVEGVRGIFVNIFQEDEFDFVTALSYEIVDEDDSVILRKSFLIGTHDYERTLENFTASSYDSILYLTYHDSIKVYAVFDLKTKRGYPGGVKYDDYEIADRLVERLQSFNSDLKAGWNE